MLKPSQKHLDFLAQLLSVDREAENRAMMYVIKVFGDDIDFTRFEAPAKLFLRAYLNNLDLQRLSEKESLDRLSGAAPGSPSDEPDLSR